MAKLLVFAVDQLDPVMTQYAVRYRKGDIVARYDDNYVFQAREGLPNFWQITVVSLLGDDEAPLFEKAMDAVNPALTTKRRKRFLDITQLSQQAQTSLAADGTATIVRLGLLNALTLRA